MSSVLNFTVRRSRGLFVPECVQQGHQGQEAAPRHGLHSWWKINQVKCASVTFNYGEILVASQLVKGTVSLF